MGRGNGESKCNDKYTNVTESNQRPEDAGFATCCSICCSASSCESKIHFQSRTGTKKEQWVRIDRRGQQEVK